MERSLRAQGNTRVRKFSESKFSGIIFHGRKRETRSLGRVAAAVRRLGLSGGVNLSFDPSRLTAAATSGKDREGG
jgi:hypothetical protein